MCFGEIMIDQELCTCTAPTGMFEPVRLLSSVASKLYDAACAAM